VQTTAGEIWLGSVTGAVEWTLLPITIRSDVPPVFSPDGSELALIGTGGEVLQWNYLQYHRLSPVTAPRLAGHLDPRFGTILLAYLNDGRLAALNSRGSLWIRTAGDWSEARPGRGRPSHARLLAPLAGGRTLAMCDREPERIEFWNVERGAPEAVLHCGGKMATGVVSPDERWLACTYVGGRIGLLSLRSPKSERVLVGHRGASEGLAFSADSRTLASAGYDGTVRLWNVATGLELFVLESRTRQVNSVAFSPDGELLAVGGEPREDGTTLSIYRANPAP
jgi:WD40 repeat protein